MRRALDWPLLLLLVACEEPAAEPLSPAQREAACDRMCQKQEECGQTVASTREECISACDANLTEDCAESRWPPTLEARDACLAGTCEALPDCLAAAQCVEPSDDADPGEVPFSCNEGGFTAQCPQESVELSGEVISTYCLANRTESETAIDAWVSGCTGEPGVKGPAECAPGPIGACQQYGDDCITIEYLSISPPRTVEDLMDDCAAIGGTWIARE